MGCGAVTLVWYRKRSLFGKALRQGWKDRYRGLLNFASSMGALQHYRESPKIGNGLGVFMPHMHDPETGEFLPLPPGIVSVEDNLQVSFRRASEPEVSQAMPVGWICDRGSQAAMACIRCIEYRGRHSRTSH